MPPHLKRKTKTSSKTFSFRKLKIIEVLKEKTFLRTTLGHILISHYRLGISKELF